MTTQNSGIFNEEHILQELKHYLPSQTALKDFIHHNSLHAFQEMDFYKAIFTAGEIFSYRVILPLEDFRNLFKIGRINTKILSGIIKDRKGITTESIWLENVLNKKYEIPYNPRIGRLRAHWKSVYHIDMDNMVQPLLFRILSSYLDQGIAIWQFPYEDKGLLHALREIEKNSFSSFFKSKKAKALLFDAHTSITSLLNKVVGKEVYYEQYIFDQQFSHRGWSGMVATVEDKPDSLLYTKKIELKELIIVELIMELDVLYTEFGEHWKPLGESIQSAPLDILADVPTTEYQEVMKIWQDAFEWSYYDEVLRGLKAKQKQDETKLSTTSNADTHKSFQAIFCIDEREDSLRRHVESVDTNSETLGCPGFFGVEFYFQPYKGKFYEKLCPAPVTPKYLIKETEVHDDREHEILYHQNTHTFLRGFATTLSLGFWAAIRLISNLFNPKMSPAISNAFAHMNIHGKLSIENKSINDTENGLQIGFTIDEMASRVEGLLRGIGLIKNFSPLVYVVAHGSSSANNPHHGAHDCGACSGRPGSVNSRVFAFMANHVKVREILANHGLEIPAVTQFVGALHDTAADEMAFYDEEIIYKENLSDHVSNKETFEKALDLNAKERSRRFASIDISKDIKHVRKAIKQRSVSLFEPRPELGHGTNALCFVGKRSLTKGLFFDRRAFMNSYDYTTDPEGKILLGVMRPLPPVCGGINLEYYFSRVDNQKLGAGTKLPHNVVGLLGVANSSDGDLRPGLPLQMIEVHDPVRLLILVEHYPDIILNTIKSDPNLYPWFDKGWVHLMSIHPDTNAFYFFKEGEFIEYTPLEESTKQVSDIHQFFENAIEMETNHIVDATQENLPVTLIK